MGRIGHMQTLHSQYSKTCPEPFTGLCSLTLRSKVYSHLIYREEETKLVVLRNLSELKATKF